MFTRFSTVLGSKGAAETAREVRGFATRFYTQQGNWDLVGNNMYVSCFRFLLGSDSRKLSYL